MELRYFYPLVLGSFLITAGPAMADSTDDILEMLISKGVLTKDEGAQITQRRKNENLVSEEEHKSDIRPVFKDGIRFESADKTQFVSFDGRIQADYRHFDKHEAQSADTFDIRRAFMTMQGKFYKYYDFNITADFGQAGGGSALDEAYFGINWWNQARFRVGQFKMPFGLEQDTSDIFTEFQERALLDSLTPGKERGAMVFGNPAKGVSYGLAASTGRGKNNSNTDNSAEGLDIIGRATVNLAELMGSKNAVYHLGADFSRGDISPVQVNAASGRTEARGITFFTPTKFTFDQDDELRRTRYGIEAAVAQGSFKIQSEWMKHNYDGKTNLHQAYDKNIKSWYAAASWLVTGESFADAYTSAGVFGRINPKSNFDWNTPGTGAVLLSLRYSDFDGSDFAADSGPAGSGNVAAGSPTGAHAWTAGVQWILNPNTRVMLDFVDTKFKGGEATYIKSNTGLTGSADEEKALTARAQFDF
ncbi:hypothetical protein LG201_10295 [Methylobacillus gramineus]|uniref:OprO/OprP family phosphate-selective porin n=1 Tax=Methylobacillus gramineus TaxID=755169 RepID=UPI001CFF6C94|nr:porin [Methylobacillus gramineus]MCB5185592.1 hypothetical protein [Methylobacillus gramineus]